MFTFEQVYVPRHRDIESGLFRSVKELSQTIMVVNGRILVCYDSSISEVSRQIEDAIDTYRSMCLA